MKYIFALALISFSFALFINYLSLPIKYESWTTKQCVFIELSDGSRVSCDSYNKDQRYLHEWVK